jgi:hypothetical protein
MRNDFEVFRKYLAGIRSGDVPGSDLRMNAVLAVGALIGAGLPGCGAAVARLTEEAFPVYDFPWSVDRDKASNS